MSAGFQTIVPIMTPYAEDGGLDAGALAAHAEVLAEGGVDGSFVGGTNGEGPLLSDDEVIEATRSVAAAAVTPYCLALTADGALEHYGTLIEAAAGTEVYAYVIPAYARNDLEPELVGRLAAQGLAGIKDSTKSWERHRAYVALRRRAPGGRFETFVGDDGMTLDAFRMGSSGGVAYGDAVRAPLPRHRAGVAR